MSKKITLLAGAISSVLSGAALADINNIIISEYVEGSSSNKAIEITNTGTTAHTFDGTLSLYYSSYKNQIKNADGANVLQGKTLQPGQSLVVVNADASADMRNFIKRLGGEESMIVAGSYEQVRHSAMNFNGDDAVWLGTSGNAEDVKDIFGIYGSSKNFAWKDRTMRRKAGSAQASTYDESQWDQFEKDDFGGLGHATNVNNDPVVTEPVAGACTVASDTILVKTVGEVQGEGDKSPLIETGFESTDAYKVTGVVSAITSFPASGFYLYHNDGNPKTSDGVFVHTKEATQDLVGKTVCVVAKAKEYYGLTQLKLEDKWEVVNDAVTPVEPVDLVRHADDANFDATLERYEGMLVKTVDDMEPAANGEKASEKFDMRVSRSFSFDYDSFRNNLVLAYKRPNPQPNQNHVPGSAESIAQARENDDHRLYVESDGKAPSGVIPYYPAFRENPHNNYIRINDGVHGLTGVIDFSYGDYRLIVPKALEGKADIKFVHNTPRTNAPDLVETYGEDGFTIKVATQNVLNYFNSPYGGSDNSFGDNRGAKSQQEFERQQAKIVDAIFKLDADIIGLMEIENNGFGDFGAINELLRAVNENYWDENYGDRNRSNSIHNRYVFVGFDKNGDQILDDLDTVGSDAISNGILYRPSKVSVVSGRVIPMPWQDAPMIVDENNAPVVDGKGDIRESGKNYQRHTVAATFKVLQTGKELTVSVNHLKSKGSTCYEDWLGWETWKGFDPVKGDVRNDDFQGSCENFRVAAAYHLGNEMAKIGGDQVVLGDLNSYAKEDPMLVLTSNPTNKPIFAAGYTFLGDEPLFGPAGQQIEKTFGYLNAVELKSEPGKTFWSYSFNDEIGSLDHMLITPSLTNRLVDATDWHINAPESSLYDYNNRYKGGDENEPNPFYAENPFRSSDHDSAIISLGYKYGEADAGIPVTVGVKSGRAELAHFIGNAELAKGDVAEVVLSPMPAGVALPKVTLTKAGKQTVKFDAAGLDAGTYTMTVKVTRTAQVAEKSADTATTETVYQGSSSIEVVKRDSSNVKPVSPKYDGSGGSFGIGALLGLIGLGWLRRRRS